MGLIGVLMGQKHRVEMVDMRVDQLLAQIGRGVDQRHALFRCSDVRSASSEQRRRRFFGFFGSQAPQPSAGRGTPAEDPQPRIVSVSVMPSSLPRMALC